MKNSIYPRTIKLAFFVGLAAPLMTLTGCVSGSSQLTTSYAAISQPLPVARMSETEQVLHYSKKAREARREPRAFDYATVYAAQQDGDISLKAFDYSRMNPKYLRQEVRYYGPETSGSIVIDARRRHLYLIQPGGMAIRYGIAVGKEGYGWTGRSVLQWKQKWPTWTPPAEMIARKPELKKYADGLKGSPANPLGARAMYLFKNGRDTLYRIHGTDKPYSIGKAASSGCFRMINQDVIDLYRRVGTKIAVQVRPEIKASLLDRESR